MWYTLEERLLILDKHLCLKHYSSDDDLRIKYNQALSYNPTASNGIHLGGQVPNTRQTPVFDTVSLWWWS